VGLLVVVVFFCFRVRIIIMPNVTYFLNGGVTVSPVNKGSSHDGGRQLVIFEG